MSIFKQCRKVGLTVLVLKIFTNSLWAQTDSLDIKIGQMIMIGVPGTTVDEKILKEVSTGKVGAIIFFEKNIPPTNSYIGLKKVIWTYQKESKIPLLIGIDQEGGRVNRLKEKYGFPKSITAAALGKSGSTDSVRIYAEATAATLSGLGININFAPCVDLAINPENPIIAKYGRAFASTEDSVYRMAKEFIIQHRKHGVLTTLKHFPGHGSSKDDTHKGLTDVTDTWEERELLPYKWLIDSGYAAGVMTTHIVHRKLEPNALPGTMSESIINGILRKRLGFQGVVFTDDMQMHAITKYYSLEEAIRLTISAGVDVMCFSNNISGSEDRTVDKVNTIIRDLIAKGQLTEARIDASYRRIMTLKQRIGQRDDQDLHAQIAHLTRERDEARQTLKATEVVTKETTPESTPKRKKRKKS